jgi:hypothetical protein
MPNHTPNSRGKIQQHRNRIDDLIKQNLIENEKATKAGDAAKTARLSQNLTALFNEKMQLFQFELTVYPTAGMPKSAAEKRLEASAVDARTISKSAKTFTTLLDATTRMADLITRLVGTFA